MFEPRIPSVPAGLLVLLGSVAVAQAQFGGFGGGSSSNGNGNPFSGNGGSGGPGQDSFDPNQARKMHGILAAVAMVVLFPIGSSLIRLRRVGLWGHALFQILSLLVFLAAVGQGVRLTRNLVIPGQDNFWFSNSSVNYHPIIGCVVLAALLVQPVFGYVHHLFFKRLGRRQVWSHLHLWNGRVFITLGIVNGGLGLKIAKESNGLKVGYAIVAAIMWVLFVLVGVYGEVKRRRANQAVVRNGRRARSDSSTEYPPPAYAPPGYREVAPGPKLDEGVGPRYG